MKKGRTLPMATDEGARSFAVILAGLEDGQLLIDLSAKQVDLNTKLAAAAAIVGKAKGEIHLKLKLCADAGGSVEVFGEIVVKEPKALRYRSVLWMSKGHNLIADNPKQTKLPLRDVGQVAPAREVPKPTDAPRSV
jgi:hypothetical protein